MALYSYGQFDAVVYYNLCDHIYLTQLNNEFIVLDVKKDLYFVCNSDCSCLVNKITNPDSFHIEKENSVLKYMLSLNMISADSFPRSVLLDKKENINGAAEIDWVLRSDAKRLEMSTEILRSFLELTSVHFYMKFKGFSGTIKIIRNQTLKNSFFFPSYQDLDSLANVINQSCLIFPKRTKCLEWAITFVMLALKKGWKCNLEVGIQNYPFYAHAWVECNGKVVYDEPDLRDKLAIILREPFK